MIMEKIIEVFREFIVLEYTDDFFRELLLSPGKSLETYIKNTSNEELAELVYSTLIKYTFSDDEIIDNYAVFNTEELQEYAINTSIRTLINDDLKTSIDYKENKSLGFYGDLLLELFLHTFYGTQKLFCRGKLYDPSSRSEPTGYDAFHLFIEENKAQMWYGEAKITNSRTPGKTMVEIIDSFRYVFSNDYLKKNLLLITKRNIQVSYKKMQDFLDANKIKIGLKNTYIINDILDVVDEFVYPIFICYESKDNYRDSSDYIINQVKKCMDNFKRNYGQVSKYNELNAKIFFILFPIKGVDEYREALLGWIKEKKRSKYLVY